jgi:hypothetical protein
MSAVVHTNLETVESIFTPEEVEVHYAMHEVKRHEVVTLPSEHIDHLYGFRCENRFAETETAFSDARVMGTIVNPSDIKGYSADLDKVAGDTVLARRVKIAALVGMK